MRKSMPLISDMLIQAEAVLFDLDGTLVDTTVVVERTWRAWAARHGVDAAAILRVCHGRRTIETIEEFAPAGIDPVTETAVVEGAMTRDTDGIVQVTGAGKLLDSLPPDRWAIVTSATRSMAEARLGQVGLPMPGILISAEDVMAGKPDPAGYRRAARELGFDVRKTIVLEDAPAGLAAGHAAGACVIAVATHLGADALADENWITDLSALKVEACGGRSLSMRVNGKHD
jgi:mannitol-1-/sugar-/sorbitol-6-phosphatase